MRQLYVGWFFSMAFAVQAPAVLASEPSPTLALTVTTGPQLIAYGIEIESLLVSARGLRFSVFGSGGAWLLEVQQEDSDHETTAVNQLWTTGLSVGASELPGGTGPYAQFGGAHLKPEPTISDDRERFGGKCALGYGWDIRIWSGVDDDTPQIAFAQIESYLGLGSVDRARHKTKTFDTTAFTVGWRSQL